MSTINRTMLLVDIQTFIRSDNIFTDPQMMMFAEKVISSVGDDDSKYEEVLCKSLKSIAINNKAQASANGPYKKIRTEFLEEEFYNGSHSNTWEEYLNSLDDICTSFGYTGLSQFSTGFMFINPGSTTPLIDDMPIDINPISTISDNEYYL